MQLSVLRNFLKDKKGIVAIFAGDAPLIKK